MVAGGEERGSILHETLYPVSHPWSYLVLHGHTHFCKGGRGSAWGLALQPAMAQGLNYLCNLYMT